MMPTEKPKIVWIVGMGRSGSMWTFNTVRALVTSCGLEAMPTMMSADDSEKLRAADTALSDDDHRKTWVLKTHKLISEARYPRSKFIATRRDPRDILISQMRFANLDFTSALDAAVYYSKAADHYRRIPTQLRLELSYIDIVSKPGEVCSKVSTFLGLAPSDQSVEAILQTYSKERVKTLIDGLDAKEQSESQTQGSKTVLRVDRNARLYDTGTGFQSGHVSDYRDGDWRRILSADQQDRMNQKLHQWLVANGYESA